MLLAFIQKYIAPMGGIFLAAGAAFLYATGRKEGRTLADAQTAKRDAQQSAQVQRTTDAMSAASVQGRPSSQADLVSTLDRGEF